MPLIFAVKVKDFREKENPPNSHSEKRKKCCNDGREDYSTENSKPGKDNNNGSKKWFQKTEIISLRTFLHCFTFHFIHAVSPV